MRIEQILQNNADLLPDYEKKLPVVVLHTFAAGMFNKVAAKLAHQVNQSETIFPETDLQQKFTISTLSCYNKYGVLILNTRTVVSFVFEF
jgi:hypothetical protein